MYSKKFEKVNKRIFINKITNCEEILPVTIIHRKSFAIEQRNRRNKDATVKNFPEL